MSTKTIKGASMPKSELNAYGVGLMRLNELNIQTDCFKQKEIEIIGQCSIDREKIIIGKVGDDWAIQGREKDLERKHGTRYGGPKFEAHYIITGKRSKCVLQNPNRDRSKPLHMMTAQEIFSTCKGYPIRKRAPKMRLTTRMENYAKMEK